MGLVQTVAPASEPLALAELKLHIGIDDELTEEHAWLNASIAAARRQFEEQADVQLLTATWQQTLDAFPETHTGREIRLRKGPVQSVAVTYLDANGATQTLSPSLYQLDLTRLPGRIVPAPGQNWPQTQPEAINAVTLTLVCGASAAPETAKLWMKLQIASWYQHRESVAAGLPLQVVPLGADALFWAERNYEVL